MGVEDVDAIAASTSTRMAQHLPQIIREVVGYGRAGIVPYKGEREDGCEVRKQSLIVGDTDRD